jgi:DNA modification methylase
MEDKNNEHLPEQNSFFKTEKLKKSARAGTQLPDPKIEPFGYDPKAKFKHLFPELNLPPLFSQSQDDYVSFGHPELPANSLYFGDNLYVLRNLPSESIDLIYIDPPFFSKRDYVQIWGDDNEIRSFQDIFEDGMFSYLAWLNARLWEMKRVLKNTGTIYVHCDWHASHYIKTEMDKIFGYDNFRNEIIWGYSSPGRSAKDFAKKHDTILRYSKSASYVFNGDSVRVPMLAGNSKYNGGTTYGVKVVEKDGKRWRVSKSAGKEYWYDIDLGKVPEDWWADVQYLQQQIGERIGYPTQKPEALLDRIIKASTNEGDIVADFFMGGGTTGASAIKNGRNFLGSDISRVAVSVAFNRLVDVGEQVSGVSVSQKAGQQQIGAELAQFPDLKTGYVGSYPINKFEGLEQTSFTKFVLGLYGASDYTGVGEDIHGLANGKIVISVGPASPSERVSVIQVKKTLEQVLRQYNRQLAAGEEKIIQIIGWAFDPLADRWKGDATNSLNKRGLKIRIELVSLSSESFRQKIFREIGESNTDLKFNRLNQLLSFTSAPTAGHIVVANQSGLEFEFVLVGAQAIGAGGRLINAQWDFDYKDERFSDRSNALNRMGNSGKYEAVLIKKHKFDSPGAYIIAARVQDNLDGEAITSANLIVENGAYKLEVL